MKTKMFRKAIRNTMVISLVLVNLFLWPYLYFEIIDPPEKDNDVQISGDQHEDRVQEQSDLEHEESEAKAGQNSTGEKAEIFKINRIE